MNNEEISNKSIITSKIKLIRNKKVILDRDLANLYQVETKVLNQAVKRNIERFPSDFMFQVTKEEAKFWKSQIVTPSEKSNFSLRSQNVTLKRGEHIKYLPYAFTEHGVAMLSSVLRSKKAVEVNIAIVRTFIMLRKSLSNYKNLKNKILKLEQKYDVNFKIVFSAIERLIKEEEEEPKDSIGFKG